MTVKYAQQVTTGNAAPGQHIEQVALVDGSGKVVSGGSDYVLPAATTNTLGGVKQAAHVDGASGTVQNIVDALVAAGIMASS